MNRTQKKCLIVSSGLHLLLGLTLIFGPGFLSHGKPDNSPILDFVTIPNAIDGDAFGGGGPRLRPPSPTPSVSQPRPQPAPPPQPITPPVTRPKPEPDPPETKPSPDAVAPPKETRHKVVANTDEVVRSTRDVNDARAAQAKRDKQAAQAAQRRLAAAFNQASSDLNHGFASGTDVKFNDGFGGTGPAYANWLQIVKSIYFNDWSGRVPEDATDDSAKALVTITIARDGTVISSHIVDRSGNPAVDKSIESTLEHIRFTAPFPENSKEDQRVLEINFSVKAVKQLLG